MGQDSGLGSNRSETILVWSALTRLLRRLLAVPRPQRRKESSMTLRTLSRRGFQRLAAGTALAAPFVRGAHAAGKLSIGFWDHWVPGANAVTKALVEEWATKEKVEVQIDFITSQGNKLLLTIAAEAQAKSGHDVLAMATWRPT